MIILGLNQGVEGVQDIYHALKGDLDQPSKDYLKEITGHKIDNTLDLLTLISDTAAGMKATSMLKAAKAARAAKAGGRLSSEMSKLREALSKAKAGSKIAKSLERKAARLVRKESRFARMKNAVGKRIRAWRPEKPVPETRVRPAVRSVGEIQKDVAAIQRDIAKAGGPQKYLKQQGAPVTELPKGVHPQDPTVPRMAAKLEKAGDSAEITVSKIDKVIKETVSSKGNLTSVHTLSESEALTLGEKLLGTGYKEVGKIGSGVFEKIIGDKIYRFRIDSRSLVGAHNPNVPHVHVEILDLNRKILVNNHIPIK